jgi:ABC-type nitrate/sulfonate/bicarbonate transport system substrate-binding protein
MAQLNSSIALKSPFERRSDVMIITNLSRHRLVLLCACMSPVLIGVVGCGPPHPKKVRTAIVPSAYYLPLIVAKEERLLEKRGYEMEFLAPFPSNTDMVEAFLTSRVDLTAQSALTMFQVEAKHPGNFRFVYGQYSASYFFVAKKGRFTTIKQIAQPEVRLGTWQSPTAMACIQLAFAAARTSKDRATIKQFSATELGTALLLGQVDAVFAFDVVAAELLLKPEYEIIEPDTIQQLFPLPPDSPVQLRPLFNGGGFIHNKLLVDDPAKAKAIQDALWEALEFIQHNPEKAREYLSHNIKNASKNAAMTTKMDLFEWPNPKMIESAEDSVELLRTLPDLKSRLPSKDRVHELFLPPRSH